MEKKQITKEKRLKKGDLVWLLVPMNGIITKISKKGDCTIKLDDLKKETLISSLGRTRGYVGYARRTL